jgi:hypothetical protein
MVRYLTMNVRSDTCNPSQAFALRYRRVNATFYEAINLEHTKNPYPLLSCCAFVIGVSVHKSPLSVCVCG